jgi:hypothetical protein
MLLVLDDAIPEHHSYILYMQEDEQQMEVWEIEVLRTSSGANELLPWESGRSVGTEAVLLRVLPTYGRCSRDFPVPQPPPLPRRIWPHSRRGSSFQYLQSTLWPLNINRLRSHRRPKSDVSRRHPGACSAP